MEVFRYVVSNEDRQDQGYTDNREETVVRSGEGQKGGKKTYFRLQNVQRKLWYSWESDTRKGNGVQLP